MSELLGSKPQSSYIFKSKKVIIFIVIAILIVGGSVASFTWSRMGANAGGEETLGNVCEVQDPPTDEDQTSDGSEDEVEGSVDEPTTVDEEIDQSATDEEDVVDQEEATDTEPCVDDEVVPENENTEQPIATPSDEELAVDDSWIDEEADTESLEDEEALSEDEIEADVSGDEDSTEEVETEATPENGPNLATNPPSSAETKVINPPKSRNAGLYDDVAEFLQQILKFFPFSSVNYIRQVSQP